MPSRLHHPFAPFLPKKPKLLILGSFPSVTSREQGFYYGHPRNQFWRILADLVQEDLPSDIKEKKSFLRRHGIALYDVIESCEIHASSDASITREKATDLSFIEKKGIQAIFANGQTAAKLFRRHHKKDVQILPSSSPAHARMSCEEKREIWGKALKTYL